MTQPNNKRYKLAEVRNQAEEQIGRNVEFETADGQVFEFTHPLFWDKQFQKEMDTVDESDTDAVVSQLLGADEFNRFTGAGGDPTDVNLLMIQVRRDMTDWMQGRPTR